MSEEEIKDLFDAIDNRLILYQATNQIPNMDFDRLVKLSVAYEELQQENKQLKEQLNEKIRSEFKLKDELFKKRKDYQETYKDVRIEIKGYKQQLKQRDEVIDDAIKYMKSIELDKTDKYMPLRDYKEYRDLLKILQKYKGG